MAGAVGLSDLRIIEPSDYRYRTGQTDETNNVAGARSVITRVLLLIRVDCAPFLSNSIRLCGLERRMHVNTREPAYGLISAYKLHGSTLRASTIVGKALIPLPERFEERDIRSE